MITVEQIRKKCPDVNSSNNEGSYCVLGALYKYKHPEAYSEFEMFPEACVATDLLTNVNRKLTMDKAQDYAARIIRNNDSGQFGKAWRLLSNAIKWKPTKKASKKGIVKY